MYFLSVCANSEQNLYFNRKVVDDMKEIGGWLGGDYDKLGLFDNKKDAERGICLTETLDDLLEEFKGKNVKITIEINND